MVWMGGKMKMQRMRGQGGRVRRGVDEICPRLALDLDWHMPWHFAIGTLPAHVRLRPQDPAAALLRREQDWHFKSCHRTVAGVCRGVSELRQSNRAEPWRDGPDRCPPAPAHRLGSALGVETAQASSPGHGCPLGAGAHVVGEMAFRKVHRVKTPP